jgi:hypothetical protein
MKRSTLYSLAVIFAVAALFLLMTMGRANIECRVCLDYHGRSNCATARGPTEQAAREGAQTTACGPIAAGMDQQIECGRMTPTIAQCQTR